MPLENQAQQKYEGLPANNHAVGRALGAVPASEDLPAFMEELRRLWREGWAENLGAQPHLLLQLYHTVAFLRYDGGRFWDGFCEELRVDRLNPNQQTAINNQFARTSERYGLPVPRADASHRLFVQSAVRHIGIPVRVWRGFISVCERLWFADHNWRDWDAVKWEASISKWVEGRLHLRRFFVENREMANLWIAEMFEARQVLDKNPGWTLLDITQVTLLRPEYFDAVPETALFLRPDNPESLFKDRPRLRLSEENGTVRIILEAPRVATEAHLPATWAVGPREAGASINPVDIPLNSDAFLPERILRLRRAGGELASYRLRSLAPWALWSEALQSFISPEARHLPVGCYTLISMQMLDFQCREGWSVDDDEELRWNVEHELYRGQTCYISRLYPEGRRAELGVAGWHRILFAPRESLELRLFPRPVDRFQLGISNEGTVELPRWPWFLLKVPAGMLANTVDETEQILNQTFSLYAGEVPMLGAWSAGEAADGLENDQLYLFRVGEDFAFPPPPVQSPPRGQLKLGGFNQLDAAVIIAPQQNMNQPFPVQLRSERLGVIPFGTAPEVRIKRTAPLEQRHAEKLNICFGSYRPWFLLTATQDHASWEELLIADAMMNFGGNQHLSEWQFIVIERTGMITRRGQCWKDFENRIHFANYATGQFSVRYAGLTTAVYPFLAEHEPLQALQAVTGRGVPPCIEMSFPLQGGHDEQLRQFCMDRQIRIMHESLWTR